MPRPYIFQAIAEHGRAHGYVSPQASYEARRWYQRTARQIRSVNVNQLMSNTPSRMRARLTPDSVGSMWMFWYDAKHKDTLPYWDRCPLLLPFRVEKDFFLGYNLHYLSPFRRAQVLNALYKVSEKEGDVVRRLSVYYGMLGGLSKYAPLNACIKMYLTSHVQSRFFYIRPEEWDSAVGLPTARFVGAGQNRVWRESARRDTYEVKMQKARHARRKSRRS